jgi:hypothetical protein
MGITTSVQYYAINNKSPFMYLVDQFAFNI